MVDFNEVKERVSIVEACQRLGIQNMQARGAQLRAHCPLCNGADPRRFVVTPAKGLWYSFCCNKGGDVISLASLIRKESLRDAAAWLMNEDTAPTERTPPQEQGRSQPSTSGMKPLEYLEATHEAVMAVGLNPEALGAIGGGYAGKGVARGSVLLPIRNEQGKLLGYFGVEELTYIPPDFQLADNVVPLVKKA